MKSQLSKLTPSNQSPEYVHLHHNDFRSQIPESWFQIPRARYLDFSENNFIGTIPTLLNSSLIQFLYLNNNSLSGPLPETLPSSIVHAWFQDNKLSGTIPPTFGLGCPKLKKLRIQENNVSGTLPIEICALENLTMLESDCLDIGTSFVACNCCHTCF